MYNSRKVPRTVLRCRGKCKENLNSIDIPLSSFEEATPDQVEECKHKQHKELLRGHVFVGMPILKSDNEIKHRYLYK